MVSCASFMNSKLKKILKTSKRNYSMHSRPVYIIVYDISQRNDIRDILEKNDKIKSVLRKHFLMNSKVAIVFSLLRIPCVSILHEMSHVGRMINQV